MANVITISATETRSIRLLFTGCGLLWGRLPGSLSIRLAGSALNFRAVFPYM